MVLQRYSDLSVSIICCRRTQPSLVSLINLPLHFYIPQQTPVYTNKSCHTWEEIIACVPEDNRFELRCFPNVKPEWRVAATDLESQWFVIVLLTPTRLFACEAHDGKGPTPIIGLSKEVLTLCSVQSPFTSTESSTIPFS